MVTLRAGSPFRGGLSELRPKPDGQSWGRVEGLQKRP